MAESGEVPLPVREGAAILAEDCGVAAAFGAVGLALAFGLAFSWISAFIGLSVRDVESAQAAGFVWVFPLAVNRYRRAAG